MTGNSSREVDICRLVSTAKLMHHFVVFDNMLWVQSEQNLMLHTHEDGSLGVSHGFRDDPQTYLGREDFSESEETFFQAPSSQWFDMPESDELYGGMHSSLFDTPHWAVTYSPFSSTGDCKHEDEVHQDVRSIAEKGFKAIRLFSTDCHVLSLLEPTVRSKSLKIIPTVYISEDGIDMSVQEQLNDVLDFRNWDLIDMIVLGNDAISYGFTGPEDLVILLQEGTRRLRAAGYTGPVTTVEHTEVISEYSEILCPHLHVLASNAQPFFDGNFRAQDMGSYVEQRISQLQDACGDPKDAFILDIGWPRKGNANRFAMPGAREQRIAIEAILAAAGSKVALSTYEDERWREAGELYGEELWGCGHLFT